MASVKRHPDYGLRGIPRATPTLRSELRFEPREFGGEAGFLIENPLTGRYYRAGTIEAAFMRRLDGRTPIGVILEALANSHSDALTEAEAAQICDWLLREDLITTGAAEQPDAIEAKAQRQANRRRMQRLNPLLFRMPLGNPDRCLRALSPWFGFIASLPFFAVWVVVVTSGLMLAWHESDALIRSANTLFEGYDWIWLIVIWPGLKVIHETAHGLFCRRFGGNAPEVGVFWILMIPLAYIDVSPIWRLGSRWQRVAVAAAGMYIELFIAAVALWIWSRTEPSLVNLLAYQTALVASAGSLLFNANFLMRFDGYHILADALGISNLYTRGQRYAAYLGRRSFLGTNESPPETGNERRFVAWYGLAAFFWRMLVIATLLIVGSTLAEGLGLVAAAIAATMWFAPGLSNLWRYLNQAKGGADGPSLTRALRRSGWIAITAAVVLSIPIPQTLRIPGIVDYVEFKPVYAETAGFVASVHVTSGDRVTKSAHIATLINPELLDQLSRSELTLREALAKRTRHLHREELADANTISAQIDALTQQRDDIENQIDQLLIRSTRDARVIAPSLQHYPGQFVQRGQPIAHLGREDQKKLVLHLEPTLAQSLASRLASRIGFRVVGRGRQRFEGTVRAINARAETAIEYPGITTLAGGSLPVTQTGDGWQLLHPRVAAELALDDAASKLLFAGERATAYVDAPARSLASRLFAFAGDWVSTLLNPDA